MIKNLQIAISYIVLTIFFVSASGVGLYKHICLDCQEVEWSFNSHHEHKTTCDDSHSHVSHEIDFHQHADHHQQHQHDFHQKHQQHQQHCEGLFFRIDKPYVFNNLTQLTGPIEIDVPIFFTFDFSSDNISLSDFNKFTKKIISFAPTDIIYQFGALLL